MEFKTEIERQDYLARKRRTQREYRKRLEKREANEAAGIVATPSGPLSDFTMPIDPAGKFNDAYWCIVCHRRLPKSELAEIAAAAEALLAIPEPVDFEDRRAWLAAERLLDIYHHGDTTRKPKPVLTPQQIALRQQQLAEEQKQKDAQKAFAKWEAEHRV
jgi:hypothetical protein